MLLDKVTKHVDLIKLHRDNVISTWTDHLSTDIKKITQSCQSINK